MSWPVPLGSLPSSPHTLGPERRQTAPYCFTSQSRNNRKDNRIGESERRSYRRAKTNHFAAQTTRESLQFAGFGISRNRLTRFHVSRCRNTENAVSIQSWELHSIRIDAICPHTRHASLSAGSRMIIGERDSSMPDIDAATAEQHYYQRGQQLCGT